MPGSSKPQDAASMHKLIADTGISARRRRDVRTTGAGQDARLQPAAGRGVDAQT